MTVKELYDKLGKLIDCGHVSVRIKGDKSGNYVRIDDVLNGNNLIVEKLFY